jgi:hypothetical protein
MAKPLFLMDANSLITPYKEYYQFRIAEGFWTSLEQSFSTGSIALLDVVENELTKGEDDLSTWIKEISIANQFSRKNKNVISEYKKILEYVLNNPCYKTDALTEWSRESVADPWLIATAITEGLVIVTFEKKNMNLNDRYPSRKA